MKLQSHAATVFIQSGSSQITRSPIHIISCWICMKLHPLRRNWQAQKQTDQNIHTFTLTHRHESERPLDVLIKPEGTAGTDDSLSRDKSAHRHAQTHKHRTARVMSKYFPLKSRSSFIRKLIVRDSVCGKLTKRQKGACKEMLLCQWVIGKRQDAHIVLSCYHKSEWKIIH